jgi:hypothetical protein
MQAVHKPPEKEHWQNQWQTNFITSASHHHRADCCAVIADGCGIRKAPASSDHHHRDDDDPSCCWPSSVVVRLSERSCNLFVKENQLIHSAEG